jgi:hypothetical protein
MEEKTWFAERQSDSKRIMRDVFWDFGIAVPVSRNTRNSSNDALRAEQLLPLENIARLLQRTFSAGALRHCDNCMQPIEEQLGYCDQRSDVAIA